MTTYGFVHLEYGSQHRQQSIAMLARMRRHLAREAMHNDRPGTHTYKWYKATPLTAETFDELRMKALIATQTPPPVATSNSPTLTVLR